MNTVSVSTDWSYRGMSTIIIDNCILKIVILPELGAKIFRLTHKPSNTNILWNNPRLKPRKIPFGASYDDNLFGGWDELFPNDAPVTIDGELYPDHGEIWSQEWDYAIEENSYNRALIHLWCFSSLLNIRLDKWLTVERDSSVIHFSHRIENSGHEAVDFLWKLHPALAISPHHRIDLPPCKMLQAGAEWSGLVGEKEFAWTFCKGKDGNTVDMRKVLRKDSAVLEFLYGVELEDGWCALTDTKTQVGFGLKFPKDVFPYVWLFLDYGGWRGHYTAILEPCNAYPFELDKAIVQGTCAHLGGGEILECSVEAVIYQGITSVNSINAGGEVIGE